MSNILSSPTTKTSSISFLLKLSPFLYSCAKCFEKKYSLCLLRLNIIQTSAPHSRFFLCQLPPNLIRVQNVCPFLRILSVFLFVKCASRQTRVFLCIPPITNQYSQRLFRSNTIRPLPLSPPFACIYLYFHRCPLMSHDSPTRHYSASYLCVKKQTINRNKLKLHE